MNKLDHTSPVRHLLPHEWDDLSDWLMHNTKFDWGIGPSCIKFESHEDYAVFVLSGTSKIYAGI